MGRHEIRPERGLCELPRITPITRIERQPPDPDCGIPLVISRNHVFLARECGRNPFSQYQQTPNAHGISPLPGPIADRITLLSVHVLFSLAICLTSSLGSFSASSAIAAMASRRPIERSPLTADSRTSGSRSLRSSKSRPYAFASPIRPKLTAACARTRGVMSRVADSSGSTAVGSGNNQEHRPLFRGLQHFHSPGVE